ncbi:MAG: L,D-transpeptidase [Thermodesulfobacteria bacterium]|nr:L,D-transpeptidase [Thermodesulfobacteriota bacterium]
MRNIIFLWIFFCLFSLSWAQDLLVVEKYSRTLYFYRDRTIQKAYPVALGWNPDVPKKEKGDGATPEGFYFIVAKRPSRKYTLFMELNYPNLKDVNLAWWEGRLSYEDYQRCLEAARKREPSPSCPLGFGIGIHGGGVFKERDGKIVKDWTYGCIALNDQDIRELYRLVKVGTPVIIYNAKRPLFETLKQFVFPIQTPGIRLHPWWGEWEFLLRGVLVKASLWEDHRGDRRLIIWGLKPGVNRLLFFYRDDNADGVLSPWEAARVFSAPGWDYNRLQREILEVLPFWAEEQILKGRGG